MSYNAIFGTHDRIRTDVGNSAGSCIASLPHTLILVGMGGIDPPSRGSKPRILTITLHPISIFYHSVFYHVSFYLLFYTVSIYIQYMYNFLLFFHYLVLLFLTFFYLIILIVQAAGFEPAIVRLDQISHE